MPDAVYVESFNLTDLAAIAPQPAQREDYDTYATDPVMRAQILAGPAWTAWRADRPLGCAGLAPIRPGCAHAWALVDKRTTGHEFIHAHKLVSRELDTQFTLWPRAEMFVDAGFTQGNRWALLLGFVLEGRYERFLPASRTFNVYARGGGLT